MSLIISAFASGLLFGLGLVISEMVNPAKVLGFLDVFGNWDPSLALVLASAVMVSALGFALGRRRDAPLFAPAFNGPSSRSLDKKLLSGAALFGVGWGLVGLCPGPALTALTFGPWQVFVFITAMMTGMALFRLLPDDWPQVTFRRGPAGVDG